MFESYKDLDSACRNAAEDECAADARSCRGPGPRQCCLRSIADMVEGSTRTRGGDTQTWLTVHPEELLSAPQRSFPLAAESAAKLVAG